MDEIKRLTIDNIKSVSKRFGATDEEIERVIEIYSHSPLINIASIQELEETQKNARTRTSKGICG